MPFVSLTLAIFRRAELGFFGVFVVTFRQTPLLNEDETFVELFFKEFHVDSKAGDFDFRSLGLRDFLIS